MDKTLKFTTAQRYLFALLTMALAASMLLVAPSLPANAAGCPPPNICGGTGGGGNTGGVPPAPTPGGTGSSGNGSTPGAGGGGTSVPPNTWTERRVPDSSSGGMLSCPRRDDGKAALGADYAFQRLYSEDDVSGVARDASWTLLMRTPNGRYTYTKVISLGRTCLYPPRTYLTSVTCSISYSVQAYMVMPSQKSIGTATARTGYSEGSKDYPSCYNSRGNASLNKPITEYGFYNVNVWQRAAVARVEVATSANEVTGEWPAPKIVSLSPAYNTTPQTVQTASLDCENGFQSPGVQRSDWTELPCHRTKFPTYVCTPRPVLFDAVDGTAVGMRSFTNNRAQFMRDGEPRKTVFSQTISGPTIKVNSITTRFLRSADSTPWDVNETYYNNDFELRRTEAGTTALSRSNGTATAPVAGQVNTIWTVGYSASDSGKPTKISQELAWKGTRTIQSGTITSVNANTGTVSWTPRTQVVPTSGMCTQTATLDYIRAIGDAVR